MPRLELPSKFSDFFDPRSTIAFLIGGISLSVVGNAAYDLCKTQVGDGPDAFAKIGIGFLLVLTASAYCFRSLIRRRKRIDLGKAPPSRRRGLIYMISRSADLLREAIKHHGNSLERIWLICSSQSAPLAYNLAKDADVTGGGKRVVDVLQVEDVNDPEPVFAVVSRIYQQLPAGFTTDDVIGDYVGMTAHASIGMALACLNSNAPLQYTPAEFDAQLRPIRPLPPFEVVLRRVAAPVKSVKPT